MISEQFRPPFSEKPKEMIALRILESRITRAILDMLKQYRPKFYAWKIHGGAYQKAGLPDIGMVAYGRAVFFEVKRPGESPTKLQTAVHDKLRRAGAAVYVVHSKHEAEEVILNHLAI